MFDSKIPILVVFTMITAPFVAFADGNGNSAQNSTPAVAPVTQPPAPAAPQDPSQLPGADDGPDVEGAMEGMAGSVQSIHLAKTVKDVLKSTRDFTSTVKSLIKFNSLGTPLANYKADPSGARATGFLVQSLDLIKRIEAIARMGADKAGNLSAKQLSQIGVYASEIETLEDLAHMATQSLDQDKALEYVQPFPIGADALDPKLQKSINDMSPFNRNQTQDLSVMSGDRPTNNHDIIWHKHDLVIPNLPGGKLPKASEQADYVFVGGGMASLVAAYELARSANPPPKIILLEAGRRFGGNSQGEVWFGVPVSTGAAYVDIPKPGSYHEKLLKDLGLLSQIQIRDIKKDPVFLYRQVPGTNTGGNIGANGNVFGPPQVDEAIVKYENVWDNGTTPDSKDQFNRIRDLLTDMSNNANGHIYPEIPPPNPEHRKYVESLNTLSFKDYLKKYLGADLHPDLETVIDYYVRSALNTSIELVPASHALNFLAGDFPNIGVLEGGNGRIAEELFLALTKLLPISSFRTESIAFDMQSTGPGKSQVTYMGPDGKARTIAAKAIGFSGAPFLLARLIDKIEPERIKAIRSQPYHSYITANIVLKRRADDQANEGYDITFGDPKFKPVAGGSVNIMDVVVGPGSSNTQFRVLTAYVPGYYDEAASTWISSSIDDFRAGIQAEINAKVLPSIGYSQADVVAIPISLKGHATPVATIGQMVTPSDGSLSTVDQLQKSYLDGIFFMGQGIWGAPGWESTVASARLGAIHMHQAVTGRSLPGSEVFTLRKAETVSNAKAKNRNESFNRNLRSLSCQALFQ